MAGKYFRSYRKNLEFIAKDIGKELMPFLSPEDIVRGLSPEVLVRILTPEEQLIGLTPEERKKLKQLLEEEDESVDINVHAKSKKDVKTPCETK
jgi:hypothetical protein